MKTAEDWYKELTTIEVIRKDNGGDMLITSIDKDQVEAIQLDAWKQGMSDAIEVVKEGAKVFEQYPQSHVTVATCVTIKENLDQRMEEGLTDATNKPDTKASGSST